MQTSHGAAILWAQYRAVRNATSRGGKGAMILSAVVSAVWYGIFVVAACAVGLLVSEADSATALAGLLGPGFLLAFLYWQLIPVLLVTAGVSLQMKKLQVYPIPHGQLFYLEVMLRASTAVEMILLLVGVAVGIVMNPVLPVRFLLPLALFFLCNLFLSVGVRDVLVQLMGWRRFREVLLVVIVMLAAVPPLLLRSGLVGGASWGWTTYLLWPWSAAARLVTGHWTPWNWGALLFWTVAAYCFGRWQFERGLRFDEEAARATPEVAGAGNTLLDRLLSWPGRWFGDPLGALIEKDLRGLVRSPRFRVVFLMGFTFGLLIWFPMAFGRGGNSVLQKHFLVVTAAYSILLLSEVLVWNVLGFDRSAAQLYWLAPVEPGRVLVAKNLVATIVVSIEFILITLACALFRLPLTLRMVADSYLVCLVILLMLMALGNRSSLEFPRPVDPNESWKRNASTKFQAMLLILYPIMAVPFVFAYYAASVWESAGVFYGVIGATAIAAVVGYGISLEQCVKVMVNRKEQVLSSLGGGAGPLTS